MNKYQRNNDYAKNRFASEVKVETVEIIGDENMEFNIKNQSTKSDFKIKRNLSEKIEDDIENVVERYHKKIDKIKRNNKEWN